MKMVTTFNTKDLVSFGQYLLSEGRKQKFINSQEYSSLSLEERLEMVHDADIANWKDKQNEGKIINSIQNMCEESLSPDRYEDWLRIKDTLKVNRSIN